MIGRSVVVGLDGSPESKEAAILGRRLSTAAHGSLHLVAAASQEALEVAAARGGVKKEAVEAALLRAATERAAAPLAGDFDPADLEDLIVARLGRPEHVIAESVREVDADAALLGGHHRRPPVSWFRRGTARRLLRLLDRPVIITGPSGSRVDGVVAAVDRSFAARPTIEAAHRLAGLLAVPLSVLHVVDLPPLPSEVGLDLDVAELERREGAAARAEIEPLLPDDADLTVLRGDAVRSIRKAVEATPATALVVGAQGRGRIHRLILGSTTEEILAELPCTLVVVPSSPAGDEDHRRASHR